MDNELDQARIWGEALDFIAELYLIKRETGII